ncbi:hypothetical protein [Streptomyces cinereoruber]
MARAWLQKHHPVLVEGASVALFLGTARARALTASCEFAAHTQHEDAALPRAGSN